MDDIDKLSGRELAEAVGREVFGLKKEIGQLWYGTSARGVDSNPSYHIGRNTACYRDWLPCFDSDVIAAIEIANVMNKRNIQLDLRGLIEKRPDAPEAICRAALRVVRQGAKAQ